MRVCVCVRVRVCGKETRRGPRRKRPEANARCWPSAAVGKEEEEGGKDWSEKRERERGGVKKIRLHRHGTPVSCTSRACAAAAAVRRKNSRSTALWRCGAGSGAGAAGEALGYNREGAEGDCCDEHLWLVGLVAARPRAATRRRRSLFILNEPPRKSRHRRKMYYSIDKQGMAAIYRI